MRGDGTATRYALAYIALYGIYGITSPYLPMLLRALGYGPAAIGLLLSVFEVAGIVGPLVLTARSDARSGRAGAGSRSLLVGTAACVLAALPLLSFVARPAATAAGLVLLALGIKTMVPLMDARTSAYAASRGPALRGGYGSMRAPGTLGYIFTALALQLAPSVASGPPWALSACIGAADIAFLASTFALPGTEAAGAPAASAEPRARRRADPAFGLGIAVIGLNRFSMAAVNSFLSIYAAEELKLRATGAIWAISAAAEIPVMLVAGSLIARTGPMPAIAVSSLAMVLRLSLYVAIPSFGGVVSAQLLHCLCYGLFLPATIAFVAERYPPERRATGMAIYMGIGVGLPSVLGSALGGFIVERFGYKALFLSFTAFAWASIALFLATRKRFSHGPSFGPAAPLPRS
jgi:PPP family 3-phenylpropionic acid transporter